jgi:N-methylhydantoinase A
MLMSDLQHDFVCSFVSVFDQIDWTKLNAQISQMIDDGATLLARESIPEDRRQFLVALDCRYVKQYHEVSLPVPVDTLRGGDAKSIVDAFHVEHRRMYGYSLEEEGTSVELINVRVRAVGITEKPSYAVEEYCGKDASAALKGERLTYIPEDGESRQVAVYDGHRTRHGNSITGPALVEQVNTTLLLSAGYDCICDPSGSFVVYERGREGELPSTVQELIS